METLGAAYRVRHSWKLLKGFPGAGPARPQIAPDQCDETAACNSEVSL